MAENIDKLVKAWARVHGADEALARKKELEHYNELHDLYRSEKKLIEASREKELEEKSGEDSWWGRRKIGMGHRWHRTKGTAGHWWQRTKKRVGNAPTAAVNSVRRTATGTPGLGPEAAIPQVAAAEMGMKAVQELQGQVKEVKAKAKVWAVRIFKIILVLIVIGIIAYYMLGTTTGSVITSEAGGALAPIKNAFKGVAAPINQFKMVLTGEYDPTQLWTSKTYEDRYATVKDIGVTISNVRPLRDVFISEQQLAILGNLKVASLPDEGTSATVSAKWSDFDKVTSIFGGNIISENWDCNGDDLGDYLEIAGTQLYIGRFMCTHQSLTVGEGKTETHTAEVIVSYNFAMKAGKQVYVGDYGQMGVLLMEEQDPLKYFGVTQDQIKSWQTESPVGLGLGLLGEDKEIIIANIYEEGENGEKYKLWHYLGVTVENKGTGDITYLDRDHLLLTLPSDVEVASSEDSDMDFKEVHRKTIDGTNLVTYKLNKATDISSKKPLKPGDFNTYYLKFRVWDGPGDLSQPDFLKGTPISSFFVLAELTFEYRDARSVAIKVKSTT